MSRHWRRTIAMECRVSSIAGTMKTSRSNARRVAPSKCGRHGNRNGGMKWQRAMCIQQPSCAGRVAAASKPGAVRRGESIWKASRASVLVPSNTSLERTRERKSAKLRPWCARRSAQPLGQQRSSQEALSENIRLNRKDSLVKASHTGQAMAVRLQEDPRAYSPDESSGGEDGPDVLAVLKGLVEVRMP
jgi:hypothetical protein